MRFHRKPLRDQLAYLDRVKEILTPLAPLVEGCNKTLPWAGLQFGDVLRRWPLGGVAEFEVFLWHDIDGDPVVFRIARTGGLATRVHAPLSTEQLLVQYNIGKLLEALMPNPPRGSTQLGPYLSQIAPDQEAALRFLIQEFTRT